jgi:hypothetical protein
MKALHSFATPGTGYPLMQCHVPEKKKVLNHSAMKTSRLANLILYKGKSLGIIKPDTKKKKLHMHFQKSEGSVLSLHFVLYQHS